MLNYFFSENLQNEHDFNANLQAVHLHSWRVSWTAEENGLTESHFLNSHS